MNQRWSSWLIGLALVLSLAQPLAARTINTYYSCLPGTVTAVVLTNASAYDHEEAFTFGMYDAEGNVVHAFTGGLHSYQSTVFFLNDFIDEPNEFSWGSLIIESSVLLQAGLWLGTETDWVSVSNLQAQSLSTEGLDIVYYWYGANYANTESRHTGIGIVNPGNTRVTGTAYIYDALGELLNSSNFELPAHGAAYFRPEDVLPIGKDSWGLIDIRATEPIVVAGEYFDAEGTLLDVDVIDTVYYLQVQEQNSGDS